LNDRNIATGTGINHVFVACEYVNCPTANGTKTANTYSYRFQNIVLSVWLQKVFKNCQKDTANFKMP
jgi:hypothetical protein